MDMNVWYEVLDTVKDQYGYNIKAGDWFEPTARTITDHNSYIRYNCISAGGYIPNRTLYIRAALLDTKIRELTKAELTQVTSIIKEDQVLHPQNHCNLASGIQVGSDPEIFVTTKGGHLIPAFEFLPAAPKTPTNGSPYWDGFQAEFQVQSSHCHAYLTDYIQQALQRLHGLAAVHSRGAKLDPTPVVVVPKKVLASAEPAHVAFGCTPSKNAYDMHKDIPEGRDVPWRFAGFHIHHGLAGYSSESTAALKDASRLVKSMDNIVGVMSVSVLDGLENPVRRQYYGLAGEYRLPKHGLEYRVLSSAVLWHPALTHLHLDMARGGMQMGVAGLDLWDGSPSETIDIINQLDVDQARVALRRNQKLITGLLGRYYGAEAAPRIFDSVVMRGIAQHIDKDVTANWHLTDGGWTGHTESAGCQMVKFASKLKRVQVAVS